MSDLSFEYAFALYELAKDKTEKDDFLSNLKETCELLKGDAYRFFTHPEIKKEDKKALIVKDFAEGTFCNFLLVLIDNDRISILPEIEQDFEQILLDESKTIPVKVTSKVPLGETYLASLKEKLTKKLHAIVVIDNVINETITAGIKIEYGSYLIDLTVDKKLSDLLMELKE